MPHLGVHPQDLHEAWDEIRLSGHLTEGKYTRLFEEAVEKHTGLPACAVNSGGTGLYTMLRMSDLKPQTPVAVPVNTFYATGQMPIEAGHSVLLIDADEDHLSMCADSLFLKPILPDAVVLTHVGGIMHPQIREISAWCHIKGIPLFEDAAHALGAKDKRGHTAGWASAGAVFSLYPTKAVPAGEGGCIVSHDKSFIERCREFRNYGKYKVDGVIKYRRSGFNFRMDEWTAAVAFLQMQRLNLILEARAEQANALSNIIEPLEAFGSAASNNWYKYPVLKADAEEMGIKKFAGNIYQKSDQLPAALGIHDQGPFHGADYISDNVACLPLDENMYLGKTKDEILAFLRS